VKCWPELFLETIIPLSTRYSGVVGHTLNVFFFACEIEPQVWIDRTGRRFYVAYDIGLEDRFTVMYHRILCDSSCERI